MTFRGSHVLVVGLGKSGLGAVRLLRGEGARVRAVDSRPLSDLPDVQNLVDREEISFAADNEAALEAVDLVVPSPGVPLSHPVLAGATARGIPLVGEVELAWHFLQGPIAAITGSNGKTTTTALTGHIFSAAGIPAQVGGNIGVAVTAMAPLSRHLQWNILELSSFQLETVSRFRADIAAILNITPNHLDRHGTLAAYAEAKGRILRNQRQCDAAVLNEANEMSRGFRGTTPARTVFFDGSDCAIAGDAIELFGKRLMSLREIPLPGRHNAENVMAAALMASLAGASHEAIAAAVTTFHGVPHRLEFVREFNGIRFYNDSKATSVDATRKALEALPGPLWVILGGTHKGASYLPLLPLLEEKAKGTLLIGAASPLIEQELAGKTWLIPSGTLEQALANAVAAAEPGDTVLLAPACSSYDQFRSYEHRGETFRQLVEQLASPHSPQEQQHGS